jgi:hypothetical protein
LRNWRNAKCRSRSSVPKGGLLSSKGLYFRVQVSNHTMPDANGLFAKRWSDGYFSQQWPMFEIAN